MKNKIKIKYIYPFNSNIFVNRIKKNSDSMGLRDIFQAPTDNQLNY
jgi:hypothetical protein